MWHRMIRVVRTNESIAISTLGGVILLLWFALMDFPILTGMVIVDRMDPDVPGRMSSYVPVAESAIVFLVGLGLLVIARVGFLLRKNQIQN